MRLWEVRNETQTSQPLQPPGLQYVDGGTCIFPSCLLQLNLLSSKREKKKHSAFIVRKKNAQSEVFTLKGHFNKHINDVLFSTYMSAFVTVYICVGQRAAGKCTCEWRPEISVGPPLFGHGPSLNNEHSMSPTSWPSSS